MESDPRLRDLHAAIAEIYRLLDVEHRLRTLSRFTRQLEAADAAAVMLPDADHKVLAIRADVGLSGEYAKKQRLPFKAVESAFGKTGSVRILDLRSSSLGDAELIRKEGLASVLSLPLVFEGRLIGTLNVYTKDPGRRFSSDDIEVAQILAAAGAIGITNSRLYAEAVGQHEQLRQAAHERDQLLSIISHELRTPLTPLKAMAQLLRARVRRHLTEGVPLDLASLDRNLATIERQVDRTNGLVNDLLSVSRAEGGVQIERVAFDLAGLVRDVVQRYVAATAEDGRHRFSTDAPPTLPTMGDRARIEQLLLNLVGNAVKYSPAGGDITVSLVKRDGEAEISIADGGIGIPREELSRLGQPFARGTGRSATFAGMGVGLYVARLVAEGHGGKLTLESDGNEKGTTVRVTLPN